MSESNYKTAQEEFWAGEFGNDYIHRNEDATSIAARTYLFSQILKSANKVESVLELGANIGLNLHAFRNILPHASLNGLELNQKAFEILDQNDWVNAKQGSLLADDIGIKADVVFTSGVLIHINPSMLPVAYKNLYENSNRYVVVIEYFNPTPVSIEYRGEQDKLFKRDFAGEMMDMYPDLELVDYGFIYKKDNNFPLDNMNWFLMDKSIK